MRFFTSGWHAGDMSDGDAVLIPVRYAEHLAALLPRLPAAVGERLASIDFHDAQIRRCTLDHRDQTLSFSLIVGDRQSAYTAIDLHYQEVAIDRLDLAALRSAAANPKSELLYDEIDEDGGYFVHRYLFWPYQAFD